LYRKPDVELLDKHNPVYTSTGSKAREVVQYEFRAYNNTVARKSSNTQNPFAIWMATLYTEYMTMLKDCF
jgi:hypothetical protein